MQRMSHVLIILIIINSLMPTNHSQQLTNTTLLQFGFVTSKYIILISDTAFNWFSAREHCIRTGYVMSQINTTTQHDEVVAILTSTTISIPSCWMGAYGLFSSNTTIDWHWDYLRQLLWDEQLATQYMVEPRFDIDKRKMQGLLIRSSGKNGNEFAWSYGNADIEFQNGPNLRRCVVCLNNTIYLPITTTTEPSKQPTLSPNPGPTFSPTLQPILPPTVTPTVSPTNIPSISPTLIPSISPSLNPTRNPSLSPSITPTISPTKNPTISPTKNPTIQPSKSPTFNPSVSPSHNPTNNPTSNPTLIPTISPTTWKPTQVNETRPPSPDPTQSPTRHPTQIPTHFPTTEPSEIPTTFPTLVPSLVPTTSPPRRDWDTINNNTGEIKLDHWTNQSCDWEALKCGHCLEVLRIEFIDHYAGEIATQHETLFAQYDPYDQCHCAGGIGEETLNHTLTIYGTNNLSTLTFMINEADSDHDDITLLISNWAYSGNNSIGVQYESCELEFYVNRHFFLGIPAHIVLKISFDITGIEDVDGLRLTANDQSWDHSDGDYNLHDLFMNFFVQDVSSLLNELRAIEVIVFDAGDDEVSSRRLQNKWMDDDIAVNVIIFTDSGTDARQAKFDLESSQRNIDGDAWNDKLKQIVCNQTGEWNIHFDHIEYRLLSLEEVNEDIDVNIDEDPYEKAVSIVGWLLVVIIFATIIVSIVIITTVVYCYCKDKKKHMMLYQKPEITKDIALSEHDGSECEHCLGEGELNGEMSGDGVIVGTVGLKTLMDIGKSHLIVPDGDSDNDIMPELLIDSTSVRIKRVKRMPNADGDMNHITTVALAEGNVINDKTMSEDTASELADTMSTFSVQTSAWNFDVDSNLSTDELLQSMIAKVCSSNKTQLINHNELWMEKLIGTGHYGTVYIAKYDGNRVAVKTFPDLDININKMDGNSGKYLVQMKGNNKGGYCSISNDEEEDEELKAFQIDNFDINQELKNKEFARRIYSREKEIYSEVVLASSLPVHPNLVEIIGITASPLKIVMTYYSDGNLQNFIYANRENNKLTLNSIIILMQKIADGILFLHNNKIVHRDIAARNVLLNNVKCDKQIHENTQVVVSDFGMTRLMTNDINCYKTQAKIGPIKWMAPESIVKKKYSYKSDGYMFGITMFEIMNKKEPYSNEYYNNISIPILAKKIVKDNMRPIIDVKYQYKNIFHTEILKHKSVIPKINKLIQACWNKSQDKRPTMLSILHTLNSIQDSMLGLKY